MPDQVRHDALEHILIAGGDVVGARGKQPLAMARTAMKPGAEAHHGHPRGPRRFHPGRGVLNHQRLSGADPELASRVKVDIGMGLSPLDMLGGAEQPVAEMMSQTEALERTAQPPGRAGRGDGFRDWRKRGKERLHPGNRRHFLESKLEGLLRTFPEVGRERPPDLRLDDHAHVAPVEADIALDGLLGSGGMAELGQGVGENGIGQDLAVDDDSVEIEDQGGEPQGRSPNKAVPTRTWVAPVVTAVT